MQLSFWKKPGSPCSALIYVSAHPSFDASVNICRACFSGCNGLPGSTLLSTSHHLRWGCSDLGRVSPFLVILVPSSCSSSATVWVSHEVDLGGLAFLWQRNPMRDMNCQTGHTGPDRIVNILSVKICQRSGVGLTLPSLRLNW